MRLLTAFAIGLLAASSAQAGPILTGSETFDSTSGLYTYSYTVDNSTGTAPVTEFDVLVNPFGIDRSWVPLNLVAPNNWQFTPATVTGIPFELFLDLSIFDPVSAQIVGTPVATGATLSGFSFQNADAPTTARYDLFQGSTDFVGTVVAPLDPFPGQSVPTPEPSSLALALLGLAGVFIARKLRRAARARTRATVPVST